MKKHVRKLKYCGGFDGNDCLQMRLRLHGSGG